MLNIVGVSLVEWLARLCLMYPTVQFALLTAFLTLKCLKLKEKVNVLLLQVSVIVTLHM